MASGGKISNKIWTASVCLPQLLWIIFRLWYNGLFVEHQQHPTRHQTPSASLQDKPEKWEGKKTYTKGKSEKKDDIIIIILTTIIIMITLEVIRTDHSHYRTYRWSVWSRSFSCWVAGGCLPNPLWWHHTLVKQWCCGQLQGQGRCHHSAAR